MRKNLLEILDRIVAEYGWERKDDYRVRTPRKDVEKEDMWEIHVIGSATPNQALGLDHYSAGKQIESYCYGLIPLREAQLNEGKIMFYEKLGLGYNINYNNSFEFDIITKKQVNRKLY